MVRAQRLLVDAQRPLIERLGLGVAALGSVQFGQVVERRGDQRVVGPQRLLADRQHTLGERDRFGVLAFTIELDDLRIERVGVIALPRHGRWGEHESPRHHHPRHKPRETRHTKPLPQSDGSNAAIMP